MYVSILLISSHLRRVDAPGAHNWSRGFFSVYGGKYSSGSYSGARHRAVYCVLYMLLLVCVVLIFSSRLGRGDAPGGCGWVSVVSSLSMAGGVAGVCCVLLLYLYILVLV